MVVFTGIRSPNRSTTRATLVQIFANVDMPAPPLLHLRGRWLGGARGPPAEEWDPWLPSPREACETSSSRTTRWPLGGCTIELHPPTRRCQSAKPCSERTRQEVVLTWMRRNPTSSSSLGVDLRPQQGFHVKTVNTKGSVGADVKHKGSGWRSVPTQDKRRG
jgi:hypothetical protein